MAGAGIPAIRGRAAVLVASIALGCSSSDTEPPPVKTPSCADGFHASGTSCEPILPDGECAAGTMAIFGEAECQPVGWTECSGGFEPDPSGWGCREIAPADACPAGTMPVLGKATCQPVGWTDCPEGFEPDPSGWGCRDILPAEPCTGATRAALGKTTCQPVGSCAGVFPPPDATLFVDDDFGPTELDATHFATVSDALAAAAAGDVIAVDSGTYIEALTISSAVSVIGKCAAEVRIESTGTIEAGVDVEGAAAVVLVRGVTIHGHRAGVAALSGAEVHLEDSVVEDCRELGVFAADAGTSVEVKGSVVRGTVSSLSGDFGFGMDAEGKASLTVEDTEITSNALVGIFVQGSGKATLTGAVVQRTLPDASGYFGHGLHVESAGTVVATASAIIESGELGVYVTSKGSVATLDDSIVRDTQPTKDGQFGIGVQADTKGAVHLTHTALVSNHYMGVLLFDAGTVADLDGCVVRDTLPLGKVAGRGLMTENGPALTVKDTAVVGNREYGIVAGGAGATLTLSGSIVQGTLRVPGAKYGWGVNVSDGATLTMDGSTLDHNLEFGLGLGKSGTTGTVTSSIVRGTERSPDVQPDDTDYVVQGIGVKEGGSLVLTDSALLDNRNVGLYLAGAGATGPANATVTGLVVRGTLPADDVGEGNAGGVVAAFGAVLSLHGGALLENTAAGLIVTGAGTSADVADLVVRGTLLNNQGVIGRAVVAQLGAALTLTRSALVENREITLYASEPGTAVTASATFIADTQPDAAGETGRGIAIQFGAALDLQRSTVVRSHDVGIHIVGDAAVATLSDVLVGDTDTQVSDGGFGHGVLVHYHSSLSLARSRVWNSAGIGLAFADSTGTVASTLVESNQVGLHAQDGSSLVSARALPAVIETDHVYVTEDTRFVDNVVRLGSGTVPIPDAATPLPAE